MPLDNLDEKEESEELHSQQRKKQSTSRHTQRNKKDQLKKIDIFIDKIIKKCDDNRSQLIAVLEARGFLIEKTGEDYFLSDHSHSDDEVYLNKLLDEANIGCTINKRIDIKKIPSSSQFYKIFFTRRGESFSDYCSGRGDNSDSNWRKFKERVYGRRTPVRVLDPCIARLIKSISEVGILTDISCDRCKLSHPCGGGSPWHPGGRSHQISSSYGPWVCFVGNINALYFKSLLSTFVKPKVALKCQWIFSKISRADEEDLDFSFLIISSSDDSLIDVYLELQDVANILYEYRIFLQNMKQSVVKKINDDNSFWQNRKKKTFHTEMNENDKLELCRLFNDNIRQYCLDNA